MDLGWADDAEAQLSEDQWRWGSHESLAAGIMVRATSPPGTHLGPAWELTVASLGPRLIGADPSSQTPGSSSAQLPQWAWTQIPTTQTQSGGIWYPVWQRGWGLAESVLTGFSCPLLGLALTPDLRSRKAEL